MTTIPVYKIDTAKGKLPKKAEVEGDQNIENGFAYARGLSKDRQNYNYYAVTEDDESKLFQIGDHVVSKEGTFLFLPVRDFAGKHSPLYRQLRMHACKNACCIGVPSQADSAVPRPEDVHGRERCHQSQSFGGAATPDPGQSVIVAACTCTRHVRKSSAGCEAADSGRLPRKYTLSCSSCPEF